MKRVRRILEVTAVLMGLATLGVAGPEARVKAFEDLHGEAVVAARPPVQQAGKRWSGDLVQGATPRSEGVRFVLRSAHATRVELEVFGSHAAVAAEEKAHRLGTPEAVYLLEKHGADFWVADIEGLEAGEVYGYRVWGPNWGYDPSWKPGTEAGFVADVDSQGNRFNPNKLLMDPYAKVFTRDPFWKSTEHASGKGNRHLDSAATQGKAVVVDDSFDWSGDSKRRRRLQDTVVYEVHVRGMTKLFPDIPNPGTYEALAHPKVIKYLKSLGVTAIELLPVHETDNDGNDVDPEKTQGKNYWGYMTTGFFAPDRRHAADQSADGPVREFKTMVKKLHAAGLEVYLDVVYNHSGEGGIWNGPGQAPDTANLISMRGIDNASYYELTNDGKYYWDNTGCGANLQTANPMVEDFVIQSLHYWSDVMGVDGFRFDLASVLGNSMRQGGFSFRRDGGLLTKIAQSYGYHGNDPVQDGGKVKLISEPWAIGGGTYQVGNFPAGWAEWNGKYRDTLRGFMKGDVGGRAMREFMNGSYGFYGDDGRTAHNSVNFVTAHDGLTLFDLVSYNSNNSSERDALNTRPWPYGPSDGGESNNHSWNSFFPGASKEAVAALRTQRARMFLGMLMLSNGTPMLLGGDERLRTQHGNNNTYNLDNQTNWFDWKLDDRTNHVDGVTISSKSLKKTHSFARNLVRFRRAHPAFHKVGWWGSEDHDGDGFGMSVWTNPDGSGASGDGHSFALRLDGSREDLGMNAKEWGQYPLKGQDLFLAINGHHQKVPFQLPKNTQGKKWYRVMDTAAWAEAHGNYWSEADQEAMGPDYGVSARSMALFLER